MIVAVNSALLGRTPAGFSDTDPYNIFFPLFIAWVFIEAFEAKNWKKTTLLACAGGPSTVQAAETAVSRASKLHGDLYGASFAADAFFPFKDAPLILANAGVISGVVPAGGQRQEEVENFFNKRNIKVGFIKEIFY